MSDMQAELDELKRKVDFNSYDISVKELLSLVRDGTIDIAPEYQRQFRWKEDRQSELIESVLLGIPIPNLFMATNADGTWELIDGVQRLSSLVHFAGDQEGLSKVNLDSPLKLEQLEKLTLFNGKLFEDLPKSIQLGFLLKPLKITTLSDKSDLSVRFDLFERLNTGGVVLSNQEIRACVYRGKFNDFLKQCAANEDFRRVVKLTATQETDGTREEYALRFFAFLNNRQDFDHSVVDFLNNYMSGATASFDHEQGERVFNQTFEALSALPDGITRSRTTTPVNLFEAVAVGAALILGEGGSLNMSDTSWIQSEELKLLTTGATNSRQKVADRIEYAKAKFA